MKIIKMNGRLTPEERETVLVFDYKEKVWSMETYVTGHYNKAKSKGWRQTVEYVYADGTVAGGVFEAPARAITIRGAEKKQVSETQRNRFSRISSDQDTDDEADDNADDDDE